MSEFPQGSVQSEVLSTTRQEFETARSEIYFVDSSVPGAEALALGLGEGSTVYQINPGDGLEQIADGLEAVGSDSIDAIHIYSQGKEGAIYLGGQWIDTAALSSEAATQILDRIKATLKESADILLYGSNTGTGTLGQSFIAKLAELASANVAASTNDTGYGRDWNLEASTGAITTTPTIPDGYTGALGGEKEVSGWGVIEGTEGADHITGFVTDDRIYGHGGADILEGKEGSDAYYINKDGTVSIAEDDNAGNDSVFSQVKDFTLNAGAAVETIVLEAQQGMVNQSATGNEYAQTMVGNALNNNLTGGGGNDYLYGYDGDDNLDGGDGILTANNYNASATMVGGKGDDQYIVRSKGDEVTELKNEGTDHVYTFVDDYTLGANVENLTLLGNTAIKAIGNDLNNEMRGNEAANELFGGKGNDTLHGSQSGEAGDMLDGGAGNDAYYVYKEFDWSNEANNDVIKDSAGNDSIYATENYNLNWASGVEHLFLSGNATEGTGTDGNNRIEGHATKGSQLYGGKGNDTLVGGTGNDLFVLDSAKDVVIDKGSAKIDEDNLGDTVQSTATVNLNSFKDAEIEVVELQGNANINATAKKTYGSKLVGNTGNNILTGGDMNDTLDGGYDPYDDTKSGGTDRLVGGKGDDAYIVRNTTTTVVEAANAGIDKVTAHVDYTLAANVENLELAGDAKIGTGNNLSNYIDGSTVAGGVILHGGANAVGLKGDTLIGGSGDNQFYSYNANDSIVFGSGKDVLYVSYEVTEKIGDKTASQWDDADWKAYFDARGVDLGTATVVYRGVTTGKNAQALDFTAQSAEVNYIVGTEKNDKLTAFQGPTEDGEGVTYAGATIDGGKGADLMIGGKGDDVFYVDNAGDTVDGGEGMNLNTIRSTVNIDINALDKNEERQFQRVDAVELLGTANLTLKGDIDSSGMTLSGNSGNNKIYGSDGTVEDGQLKKAGADTIDGGAGADSMYGGRGDDLYSVDNAKDRVFEDAGELTGKDTIKAYGVNIDLNVHKNVEVVENWGDKDISMTGTKGAEEFYGYGNITKRNDEGLLETTGKKDQGLNDTINGGGGADIIDGGKGDDNIFYYGTEAKIDGGEGWDTLTVAKAFTGSGVTLNGAEATAPKNFEAVVLQEGAVVGVVNASNASTGVSVQGNSGDNRIIGSAFNDSLVGGGGVDNIEAGKGDDTVVISANANGYGKLDGGEGFNTLDFGTKNDNVTFTSVPGDNDTFTIGITQKVGTKTVNVDAVNFDVFTGGDGKDTLDASGVTVDHGFTFAGGAGADIIKGGAGSDTVIADGGNDTISTSGGNDVIRLTTAAKGSTITVTDFDAAIDSVDVSDLYSYGENGEKVAWELQEPVQKGAHATLTWVNPLNAKEKITVVFQNTVGADILSGKSLETDKDFDAAASDNPDANPNVPWTITATGANTEITGGHKGDHLISEAANVVLKGGNGNDTLEGSGSANQLNGDAGNDVLIGLGSDKLAGGEGNDTLTMYAPTDSFSMDGGAGDDHLRVYSASGTVAVEDTDGSNVFYLEGVAAEATVTFTGSEGNDSLTVSGVSGGTVSLDGANGDNAFYINNVESGTVSATGGTGTDTFRLGSVTAGTVTFTGGDGTGTGENPVDVLELTDPNGAKVTLTASGGTINITGIESVKGTALGDVIDASDVSSALTVNGEAGDDILTGAEGQTLLGGEGDDKFILKAAVNSTVDGGAGNDTLVLNGFGVTATLTNGKLTFPGSGESVVDTVVTMTDVEVIEMSASGGDITIDEELTDAPILEFGAGVDILTLTDAAAGSTIVVDNYNWDKDKITADGWSVSLPAYDKNTDTTTYTYTQADKDDITVQLKGVKIENYSESTKGVSLSADAGDSVVGSTYADSFAVTLGGTAPMKVLTGGVLEDAEGRDSVSVSVNGNVDAGLVTIEAQTADEADSSHSRFYMQGDAVDFTFSTQDEQTALTVIKDTVSVNGEEVGYTANLKVYGFSKYVGTAGADTVRNDGGDLQYETNGGNDSYTGGSGRDSVYASPVADTAMTLNGGAGDSDWLFLEKAALEVSLDANGDISTLKVGEDTIGGSYTNFETYAFDTDSDNNFADVVDAKAYVTSNSEKTIYVNSYGGNDTFDLTGKIAEGKNFIASAGEGDDTFDVGTVTKHENISAGINLNGGTGNDTYKLQAGGYSLTINEMGENNGADKIQFYGLDAETVETGSTAQETYLESLMFTYIAGEGGVPATLTIGNVQGSEDTQTLTFMSTDFTGDTLSFYDAQGNELLAGIDLGEIAGLKQSGTESLDFAYTEGKWTVTAKDPAQQG